MKRLLLFILVFMLISTGCSLGWHTRTLPDNPPSATELPVVPDQVERIQRFGVIQSEETSFFHSGIDFTPKQNMSQPMNVYAIASGIITEIDKDTKQGFDASIGARNFKITMYISKDIAVIYHFEAALDQDERALTSAEVEQLIHVDQWQHVEAGTLIGLLPWRDDGTHLHFTIAQDGRESNAMPCPLGYFDSSRADEFESFYDQLSPDTLNLCGEAE